ncbi:hypothetical protein BJF78_02320 [Pseudonocardia sp. CNS-139]|nr:hypothetical protein BJF78_02320 [Pseudonocardia sp. CNS-139]
MASPTDGAPGPLGVVVGADGTRTSLDAVRWAAAEARVRRLPLRILHAAPYAAGSEGPLRHRADDILARAFTVARRAEPEVPVTTERTDDEPAPSLLAAARRARLVVVGMGGGRGAFADARCHGDGVVVLHAGPDGALLAEGLRPWTARHPDVPVRLEVVAGQPAAALLAASVTARLLVVGTHGRGAAARALFGSTSRQVLRRSPVPVVVVDPAAVAGPRGHPAGPAGSAPPGSSRNGG